MTFVIGQNGDRLKWGLFLELAVKHWRKQLPITASCGKNIPAKEISLGITGLDM
jgi:hypothetical protein